MQELLKWADQHIQTGTRIMLDGFQLQSNIARLPVIIVTVRQIQLCLGAPIPVPLPSTDANLLREQDSVTGSKRQKDEWFFNAGQVVLDSLNIHHRGLIITCLQNIALAALRLRHFTLALAYALAAVRVAPRPTLKALYRAALAAAHLHEYICSLYLLKLVRCTALCQDHVDLLTLVWRSVQYTVSICCTLQTSNRWS